ncbi:hypothetical protein HPB48_019176 [Haemaphysalis longicornis]|uniref:Uncharacterized protein n=1 Tax=Haemaphysalis longicornis TaxID=44386 RepID=A0A9J6G0V0_HAELO|nr:hypothetical protein HPB48_019176 [Haemaphysalis longicornis]
MEPNHVGSFFVHSEGSVRDIAMKVVQTQEEDNAFYVCDLRELKRLVGVWKKELPRVIPFYAEWSVFTHVSEVPPPRKDGVRSALDKHFPPSGGTMVIAEPGEFFSTSPYTLAVKIVAKRTRQTTIDGMGYKLLSSNLSILI